MSNVTHIRAALVEKIGQRMLAQATEEMTAAHVFGKASERDAMTVVLAAMGAAYAALTIACGVKIDKALEIVKGAAKDMPKPEKEGEHTRTRALGLTVGATYSFEYTNHRGATLTRIATFRDFQIIGDGHEEYYPAGTHCFNMLAHDRDHAPRSFAIERINFATWERI